MVRVVFQSRVGKFLTQLKENEIDTLNAIGEFCVGKMNEYVAVDTGYLRSRNSYVINRNELMLHNDCHYAGYQEYGTYKMRAHPFFKPAVYNHINEIRAMAGLKMARGLR